MKWKSLYHKSFDDNADDDILNSVSQELQKVEKKCITNSNNSKINQQAVAINDILCADNLKHKHFSQISKPYKNNKMKTKPTKFGWRTKLIRKIPFIKRHATKEKTINKCGLCSGTLKHHARYMRNCPHGFCESCLRSHIEGMRLLPGEKLNCPTCKVASSLPIDKLPTFQQIICSLDSQHGPATMTCNDCQKSVCQECAPLFLELHQSKILESHSVTPTKPFKCHSNVNFCKKRLINCKRHIDQLCEKWCNNCSLAICNYCVKTSHKEHEYVDLKALAEKRIAELEYLLTLVIEKLKNFKRLTKLEINGSDSSKKPIFNKQVDDCDGKLEEYYEDERKRLKKAYKEALKAINDQEKLMKDEIDKNKNGYVEAVNNFKTELNKSRGISKRLLEHINYLINDADYNQVTHDAVLQVRKEVEMVSNPPESPKLRRMHIQKCLNAEANYKIEFILNKTEFVFDNCNNNTELNNQLAFKTEENYNDCKKLNIKKKNTSTESNSEFLIAQAQPLPSDLVYEYGMGSLDGLMDFEKDSKRKRSQHDRTKFSDNLNESEKVIEIFVNDYQNRNMSDYMESSRNMDEELRNKIMKTDDKSDVSGHKIAMKLSCSIIDDGDKLRKTDDISSSASLLHNFTLKNQVLVDENRIIRDICLTKDYIILALESAWNADEGELLAISKDLDCKTKKILFRGAIRCCSVYKEMIYFTVELSKYGACRMKMLNLSTEILINVDLFSDVKSLHVQEDSGHFTIVSKLKNDTDYSISHWNNKCKLIWKENLLKCIKAKNYMSLAHDFKSNVIMLTDCENLWRVDKYDDHVEFIPATIKSPNFVGLLSTNGFLISYENGIIKYDDNFKEFIKINYTSCVQYDGVNIYVGCMNGYLYVFKKCNS